MKKICLFLALAALVGGCKEAKVTDAECRSYGASKAMIDIGVLKEKEAFSSEYSVQGHTIGTVEYAEFAAHNYLKEDGDLIKNPSAFTAGYVDKHLEEFKKTASEEAAAVESFLKTVPYPNPINRYQQGYNWGNEWAKDNSSLASDEATYMAQQMAGNEYEQYRKGMIDGFEAAKNH